MEKSFWPSWVFAIVAIFGRGKVRQQITLKENRKLWTLHVDLTDESYGIYSKGGKKFLNEEFLAKNRQAQEEVRRRSKVIHEFMQPGHHAGEVWEWNDHGSVLPLRWASGGVLPLVWYKNANWVLLFFRDTPPVGLNVPNGASEDKDEYKDLRKLIDREFCEEVVILSGSPTAGKVTQCDFHARFREQAPFMNSAFSDRHNDLRKEHDGLEIGRNANFERKVEFVKTPFIVGTTYHEPNLGETDEQWIEDVVYTVNPAEFGIEVLRLAFFDLEEGEYIIDGEFDLARHALIRRPPILIRLSHLLDVYDQHGSLGNLLGPGRSADGKLMDVVPPACCVVFDADVALREKRAEKIRQELNGNTLSRYNRDNVEWEKREIIDSWLQRYGKIVATARTEGLQGDDEVSFGRQNL